MKKFMLSVTALLLSSSSISAKIGIRMPKRKLTYVTIGAIRAQNSLSELRRLAKYNIRQENWHIHTLSSELAQDDEAVRQEQLMFSYMRDFDRALTISSLVDDEEKNTEGKKRDCVRNEPTIKDTVKDSPKKNKEKGIDTKKIEN